jgi:hypothetical protein
VPSDVVRPSLLQAPLPQCFEKGAPWPLSACLQYDMSYTSTAG